MRAIAGLALVLSGATWALADPNGNEARFVSQLLTNFCRHQNGFIEQIETAYGQHLFVNAIYDDGVRRRYVPIDQVAVTAGDVTMEHAHLTLDIALKEFILELKRII